MESQDAFNYKHVRKVLVGVAFALASLVFVSLAFADEIRYKPVNPSFGGDSLNGSFLLGQASAQKRFSPHINRPSAVEQFSETISRTLLSKVAHQISETILGENASNSGSFTVGDTAVDFKKEGQEVVINVVDSATGNKTVVKLPVPTY